jgi:hypothetical protein
MLGCPWEWLLIINANPLGRFGGAGAAGGARGRNLGPPSPQPSGDGGDVPGLQCIKTRPQNEFG